MIKDTLLLLLLSLAVVGSGMAFVVSPSVLIVIACIMFGINGSNTINLDKAAKWDKLSATMPVTKKEIVASKYILYAILCFLGIIIGLLITIGICAIKGSWDVEAIGLLICAGLIVALVSGSVTIPCNFLCSPEQSTIAMMLSYAAVSGIFAGALVLLERYMDIKNSLSLILIGAVAVSMVLYILSGIFMSSIIYRRDL